VTASEPAAVRPRLDPNSEQGRRAAALLADVIADVQERLAREAAAAAAGRAASA
jgi:hypothetical protein